MFCHVSWLWSGVLIGRDMWRCQSDINRIFKGVTADVIKSWFHRLLSTNVQMSSNFTSLSSAWRWSTERNWSVSLKLKHWKWLLVCWRVAACFCLNSWTGLSGRFKLLWMFVETADGVYLKPVCLVTGDDMISGECSDSTDPISHSCFLMFNTWSLKCSYCFRYFVKIKCIFYPVQICVCILSLVLMKIRFLGFNNRKKDLIIWRHTL